MTHVSLCLDGSARNLKRKTKLCQHILLFVLKIVINEQGYVHMADFISQEVDMMFSGKDVHMCMF